MAQQLDFNILLSIEAKPWVNNMFIQCLIAYEFNFSFVKGTMCHLNVHSAAVKMGSWVRKVWKVQWEAYESMNTSNIWHLCAGEPKEKKNHVLTKHLIHLILTLNSHLKQPNHVLVYSNKKLLLDEV